MNLYGKYGLSPNEITLCDLMLQGMTLTEIADQMFLAYKTVHTYKCRAFNKLNVRNRAELQRLKISAMLDDVPSIPDQWQAGYRSALQEILN